jgi:hypothetical protein
MSCNYCLWRIASLPVPVLIRRTLMYGSLRFSLVPCTASKYNSYSLAMEER